MTICEVCGKKNASKRANIEGAVLEVCEICGANSLELPKLPTKRSSKANPKPVSLDEETLSIVPNFSSLVREAREAKGFTRLEVATALREKESVISRTEQGVTPTISVARKLGKFFKIKLVEEYSGEEFKQPASPDEEFTLGDLIKVK